jgi:hypothetical protein
MWAEVLAQTTLKDNLEADSTILKLRISKITENGFGSIEELSPIWTKIETFDTLGRISQRTDINYAYHKFVCNFKYNEEKKEVTITEKFYDWNPHRGKNKNDTILKASREKYDLRTKENKKYKPSKFSQFQAQLTIDSMGRLIQSKDTIKFGYQIVCYLYDPKSNLVERKHFIMRHSEKLELFAKDSLVYNSRGQKIKEINYMDFEENNGMIKHNREVETVFQYNNLGLIERKTISIHYLRLKNANSNSTVYKYEYVFY